MPKKKPKTGKPEVHQELSGFDISIDAFGEIKTNVEVDKLNRFLDDKVEDKKLSGREDQTSEE